MKQTYYIFTALVAAAMLGACSTVDEPKEEVPTTTTTDSGYILFGCGDGDNAITWTAATEGRGGASVVGFIPQSVGIFGYNNFSGGQSYQGGGEVFNNTQLYWRNGELFASSGITSWVKNPDTGAGLPTDGADNMWPYTPPMPWLNESTGVKYKFFAYSPYTQYGEEIEAFGRSYDSFESIEWHHIPKYSTQDYMVSDRIVEYTSRLSNNDLQFINMTHLQARIRFCFKLGPEFSTLRMIRVKKVEIVGRRGFFYTLTVHYSPVNEGGIDVLRPSFVWTIETGTDPVDLKLYNEPDPMTMEAIPYIEMSRDNDEYQALASLYVYPNDDLTALQIRVTYDVYDYYPETGKTPVLLRENDIAENNVPLTFRSAQSTSGTGPKLEAGYYYDVRIRVEPSYLYVLSDNDFDADGYLIINDD